MGNSVRKSNRVLFSKKESTILMWGIFIACSVVSTNVVVDKIQSAALESESFYQVNTAHAATSVLPAV